MESALACANPFPWGWLAFALGLACLLALIPPRTSNVRSALALVVLLSWGYALLSSPTTPPFDPERGARANLYVLRNATWHFRELDTDGNGKKDFWRRDIAGLYTIKERKSIELSLALADDRPGVDVADLGPRAPFFSYSYRALRFADEKDPDPDRWAACAFPENPKNCTILITDDAHMAYMYRRKGRHPLDVVPSAAELQRDWIPVR